jgi:hypothetical protein
MFQILILKVLQGECLLENYERYFLLQTTGLGAHQNDVAQISVSEQNASKTFVRLVYPVRWNELPSKFLLALLHIQSSLTCS